MELTRKQFEVLASFTGEVSIPMTQRKLEDCTGYALGTINKIVKELTEAGLVADGSITNRGIDVLEPYRAKRAVFLAAGLGARLVPVTLNTPKPLIRVNGKRLIDTLIDACLGAGINEIYIVRGYLSEQFDQLLYKYPMLKFIENPAYNEENNISSAMAARYFMQNAYVFEADILLSNPRIIRKYNYSSNYLGIPMQRCDDWCFTLANGKIKTWKIGGLNCYQEIGISYWTEEDGCKLCEHIKKCYEMPGGKELFWDYAPLQEFKNYYNIEVRECKREDVIEVDTFNELKKIAKTYDV